LPGLSQEKPITASSWTRIFELVDLTTVTEKSKASQVMKTRIKQRQATIVAREREGMGLVAGGAGLRLAELGIVLPSPPTPLGAYVESSEAGNLLFLSGILPVANRKLAIAGRLGENLSVKEGQDAARIASLNALAVAQDHLGKLDRLKKLIKLTVLIATTERFSEHADVANGASDLFAQVFGPKASHTRLVYGVYSLPIGAPVIVDTVFEIEPVPASWD
jgi:enamine deaminase RidA (YjgF/YER057c/UK114 family)